MDQVKKNTGWIKQGLIKVWPNAVIWLGSDTNEMNKFHLLNMK
jgi:hypothetical protein